MDTTERFSARPTAAVNVKKMRYAMLMALLLVFGIGMNRAWGASYDWKSMSNTTIACGATHTVSKTANAESTKTVTFTSGSGCPITIRLTSASLASGLSGQDRIEVYNGSSATGTVAASWTSSGGSYTSTSGYLTVKFVDVATAAINRSSFTFTVYTPCKATLSFNTNQCPGCGAAPASISDCPGSTVTLPAGPSCMEYQFLGWATSSTATTATYQAGGSYTLNSNTTLYAVCREREVIECDEHRIGTGTSTSYSCGPVNNFYKYSYNQMLFTRNELGNTPGTIYTIGFEYQYATAMTKKTNVNIYMANTTKSSFASSTDWVTAGLQLVYSGPLNCAMNGTDGWNDFFLNTPFEYTGNNVVVVIDDNSNQYDGTAYTFRYSAAGGSMMIASQSDNDNYSNTNLPTSASVQTNRVNTRFCIAANCQHTGTLNFPVGSVSLTAGDTYTQTPTNTTGRTGVTYSSSNTSLATVNATTGAVTTLAGVEGDVTITATLPASGTSCAEFAEYVIHITDGCSQVGNGTSHTSYTPVYTWNSNYYGYSQQLYKATEITAAGGCRGTIGTLKFDYYGKSTPTNLTSNITIYMGTTTQTSLANGWISDANLVQVYSGSYTFRPGWNSIDILGFDWDGLSNIVVAVSTNNTQSTSDFYFNYASEANGARYVGTSSAVSMNNATHVPSTESGSVISYRPNIRFCIDCCEDNITGTFAYPSDTLTYVIGSGTFTPPTLTNTTGRTTGITYRSSNTSIATVNATTGAVTFTGTEGYVTITAILSNSTGCPKYAQYVVRVNDGCARVGLDDVYTYGYYGPIYTSSSNYYSYSQQIYKASEIRAEGGCQGKINNIKFQYYGTTNMTVPVTVYVGKTGQTNLTNEWISDANLTQVYNGSLTFSPGWVNVNFTTPYEWDGISNIVIALRTTGAPTTSSLKFYYTSIPNGMRYTYSSGSAVAIGTNYVPTTATGTSSSYRPNVKFCIDCCEDNLDGVFRYVADTVGYVIGSGAFTAPELTNTTGQSTITYTSSNTSLATVNASGVVTPRTTEGYVTITARLNNPDGCPKFAHYVININDGCKRVGEATTTTSYYPNYYYYKYSWEEIIYTADEIGGGGTINRIGFKASAAGTLSRATKVYVGLTDKRQFNTTTDFIPLSELTLVYNGNWTTQEGWNFFNFSTPFTLPCGKNLVVALDIYNSSSSSENFYYTSTAQNRTLYAYSDTYDNPVADMTTYSGSSSYTTSRPNIKICMEQCVCPEISFSARSVRFCVGGSNETPELTCESNGTRTYTSSNTSVITVNRTTGAVTPVSAGTATITVTVAGTDDYCPAAASYNVTVMEHCPTLTYDVTTNCTGTGSPSIPSYTGYGMMNLSTTVPTCSTPGTTFAGWCTTPTGEGGYYQPGADFALYEDVTLYAIYFTKCCHPDSTTISYTHQLVTIGDSGQYTVDPDAEIEVHRSSDGFFYFPLCLGENDNKINAHVNLRDDCTYTNKTWSFEYADGTNTTHTTGSNSFVGTVDSVIGYDLTFTANSSDGCMLRLYGRVKVSPGVHIIEQDVPEFTICPGNSSPVTIGYDSQEYDIQIDRPGTNVTSTLGHAERIFLPDGIACDIDGDGNAECGYVSSVVFTEFQNGAVIRSAEDILYLSISIEHSFIGDIVIMVTCPNGQTASILNQSNNGAADCLSSIPEQYVGWVGSGGTSNHFGIANDSENSSNKCDSTDVNNAIGTPWTYAWSDNTTRGYSYAGGEYGFVYEAENIGNDYSGSVDSTHFEDMTQVYHPEQSFDALVGCPLNGEWKVTVIDGWGIDNGWLTDWQLALSDDLIGEVWNYHVGLDTAILACNWTASNAKSTAGFVVEPPTTITTGDYTCEATLIDEFGCINTSNIELSFIVKELEVTATPSAASCGGSDGSITVTATGDGDDYMYSLNGGTESPIGYFGNLSGGTYSVTVRSSFGCERTVEVEVPTTGEVNLTSNVTNAKCKGSTDGAVVVVGSGAGTHTYTIGSTSNTTGSFTGLGEGDYVIMAVDEAGCTGRDTVHVSAPDSVRVQLTMPTTGQCPLASGSTYSITSTATGGSNNFVTYAWSGDATGSTSTGTITSDGTCHNYTTTLTVTDSKGCQGSATGTFSSVDNTKPVITTTATNNRDLGCNPTVTAPTFSCTDNCQGTIATDDINVTTAGVQGTGCSKSQTWTANYTDACGNAATPVSITYTWTVDTQKPVISTTATSGDKGCNPTITAPTFTCSDNCEGTVDPSDITVTTAGVQGTGCSKSQTWTANYTDACGNAATAVSITYTWTVDTQKPVISTTATSGDKGCNPTITAPTFTCSDNCEGTVDPSDITVTTAGVQGTGCSKSQTWTANYTDACGNAATAVTITYTWTVDTQKPVISTTATSGDKGCNPTITAPTFTCSDNCEGTVDPSDITVTTAGVQGTGCSKSQTWTANYTDACGNAATAVSITYTWTESTTPTITTTLVDADKGCDWTEEAPTAANFTVIDGCDASATATVTPGTLQTNGCEKSRTYTASYTNACNQSATPVSVTYNWTDATAPTIATIATQDGVAGSNCKYTIPNLQTVTLAASTDNCGGTVTFVSQSVAAGTEYAQNSTDYTVPVTVTVKGTCDKTATATVNVLIPANDITMNNISDQSICSGGSVTLTASGSSSNGNLTYAWTPTTGLSATTGATVTATPTATTTYTVTGTDPTGCTATEEVTVTINPLVTLAVTPTEQTVCLGTAISDITITNTNSTINTLTLADGLTQTNGVISGTPTTAGDYTYTIVATSNQTPQCDPKQATVTIHVTDTIVPVISSDDNVCVSSSEANNSITISETVGDNSYTYQWTVDGGTITSGSGTGTIAVNWATAGDKAVTVTMSKNGCSGTKTKVIHVRPKPAASIAGVTGDVCPNVGTIDITGSVTTATTANYTYTWGGDLTLATTPSTTANTTHMVTATIPADCNETYDVTLNVVDNYGCKVTASPITVTVKDETAPVVTGTLAAQSVEGCSADLSTLYPAQTTVAGLEALGLAISDNCTADADLDVEVSETNTGNCPIVVTRTYTITDGCGNSSTISQTITVNVANNITVSNVATSSTVDCESMAVATNITLPTVTDACNNTLTPETPAVDNQVSNCEGTVTYTYTYTDCAGHTAPWTYEFTVDHPDLLVPADSVSNVPCVEDVVEYVPAAITDACGNTINPVAVAGNPVTNITAGSGTVVYNYTYTDCEGTPIPWKITYNVVAGSFTPATNGEETVNCANDVHAPTTPSLTVCGNTVDFGTPVSVTSTIANGCGDSVYTYNYEVNGTTYTWTYTYHVSPAQFDIPTTVTTADTVECYDDTFVPTLPTVTNSCGTTILPTGPVMGGTYVDCEGTITYTYTYADCVTEHTRDWTFTRHIIRTTSPTQEGSVATSSSAECVAGIAAPTTLPVVKDVCGNVLTAPTPVEGGTYDGCSGTKTYTYTYTDCVDSQYVWTYTYNILHTTLPTQEGTVATSSDVQCESDATAPTTLPVVKDVCGNVLTAPAPVEGGTFDGCSGTKTYTYTYTDCQGLTYEWVYTYNILHTTTPTQVGTPVAVSSDVNCLAAVVAPTALPVVNDVCGATLTAPTPVEGGTYNNCNGTKTYKYTYTDCQGLTYEWTYTYNIDLPALTIPADGSASVACESDAVVPAVSTLTDACGNTVAPVAAMPASESTVVNGTGDVTYYYTYTDCEQNVYPWQFVYHVSPTAVEYPADVTVNVNCATSVVAPAIPVITICGSQVDFGTPTITGDATSGCGTVTYTYHYSINGVDTAWRYTYEVEPEQFDIPTNVATSSTIQCYDPSMTPTLPVVTNSCNTAIQPSAPVIGGTYAGCEGTVTYTYTYEDCVPAHTRTWTYTYNVDRTSVPTATAVATSSNVQCADAADGNFALPVVTDICGTELAAPAPVISGNAVNCNGSKVYTYTYQDCSGLQYVFTYTYNINDNIPPTIDPIAAQDAVNMGNCSYAIPNLQALTMAASSDNCNGPVTFVSQMPAAGAVYNPTATAQTIPVTVTVADACGNQQTATVNVTIPANTISVTTSGNASICEGQSTVITATGTSSVSEVTYVWSPATALSSTTAATVMATPTTTQTYTVSVQDANGCTAQSSVTVTVSHAASTEFTQTACDSYTWNNNGWSQTYDMSGDYLHNYTTAQGCASTDVLHLTINYNTSTNYTETVCETYTWNNHGWSQTYTNSGTYTHNYNAMPGNCPSTDVLTLTVNHNTSTQFTETVCDSYVWNNHGWANTYTTSGNYSHDYTTAQGCPSTDVLHLTVHYSTPGSISASACDSYSWYGNTYTAGGDYTHMLHTTFGCDSLLTLHLTINNSVQTNIFDTICAGATYSWYGTEYAEAGTYNHTAVSSNGCDSTIVLYLYQMPVIRLGINEVHDCKTGVYTLTANASNSNIYMWSSTPDDPTLSGQESERVINVHNTETVTYTVVAGMEGHMECAQTASITLDPVETPIAAFETHPEYLTLERLDWYADDRSANTTWRQWFVDGEYYSDLEHINGVASAGIDSLYIMLVTGNDECSDTAMRAIPYREYHLWVPNAFTPNMDYNNYFGGEGMGIISYEMYVYTREGLLVFHSDSQADKWDGTHDGKKCQQGTYTYRIVFRAVTDPDEVLTKVGTVLLLR